MRTAAAGSNLPPGWFVNGEGVSTAPAISVPYGIPGAPVTSQKCFAPGETILEEVAVLTVPTCPSMYTATPLGVAMRKLGLLFGEKLVPHRCHMVSGFASAGITPQIIFTALLLPLPKRELLMRELPNFKCRFTLQSESDSEYRSVIISALEATLRQVPIDFAAIVVDDRTHPAEPTAITFSFLCRLISVFDSSAVEALVPGLALCRALFPLINRCQHECRPNSHVVFLNVPADFKPEVASKRKVPPDTHDFSSEMSARVTAIRDVPSGAVITKSLLSTSYMATPDRRHALMERFGFECQCRWCIDEFDLPRAFKCPRCAANEGCISPRGDGTQWDRWECFGCGLRPTVEMVQDFVYREVEGARLKEGRVASIAELLADSHIHYSHHLIFSKLERRGNESWLVQDARSCVDIGDVLLKCVDRVLQPNDPAKARYHEYLGRIHHALGNAHTARAEYLQALKIRELAGERGAAQYEMTKFMAIDKPLAELMDSK